MTNDMTVQTSGPALRIGLIGAGKMAVNHLRAIQGSGLARVVGIADPAVDHQVLDGLIPKDAKISRPRKSSSMRLSPMSSTS